jgi:hypothetical protein
MRVTKGECEAGDLRNTTQLVLEATVSSPGLSELGESIGAFGELVAVMRATGNLIDDEMLEALIVRIADLLGEPLPLGLEALGPQPAGE